MSTVAITPWAATALLANVRHAMELVQVSSSAYACLQLDGGLGANNSGFIDRGGGLVIDTFWDLPRTRELISRYSEINPKAPRRLVNTHHNGDHTWGNQLFAKSGTEIIGHKLCAEYFATENPAGMQMLAKAGDLPPAMEGIAKALRRFDFEGIELTPPSTLIEHDTSIDLGSVTASLLYVGPAHTAGDVAVYLKDESVLFTGDVLFNQCTPVGWKGTFSSWIAALDRLAALEPETVVPGHGPMGTAQDLLELKEYLEHVYNEARSHYDKGHTTLEAAQAIELGRWSEWEEPERLAFQVNRAYREFEGANWDERPDISRIFSEVATLRQLLYTNNTC